MSLDWTPREVRNLDALDPNQLCRVVKDAAAAGWATYEEWGDDDINQDGLGLLDWASLLLAGELTGTLVAKMVTDLRLIADNWDPLTREDDDDDET